MKITKHLFYFTFLLLVMSGYSFVNAEIFKSDKELGKCGSSSLEQKRQKQCEGYDNERDRCKKESGCSWTPEPKICGPNRNRPSEQETEFCEQFQSKRECLDNGLKCDWGYKKPTCNALDTTNQEDIEFCETLDSNEGICEKHEDRCDWG